jgi:hypothetical protein
LLMDLSLSRSKDMDVIRIQTLLIPLMTVAIGNQFLINI